jgi:dienelactone hydrolase
MSINKTKFTCNRDNLKICGNVWREKEGILPGIILSHGFMANGSMCHTYAKMFASMGYAAFTFDFCGGGLMSRSDGKSEDMSVLTEMQDLEAVISYVKGKDYIDKDNISLLGCSQGGFVSALVAKTHPELRHLVMLYPAFCIPDDARAGKMLMFSFDPDNMPDILTRLPMKIGKGYATAVMDWDYREVIKGYVGNTILIHGTADDIVNIEYARNARASFPDCHYYEIQGGEHMFRGEHDKEAMKILMDEMKISSF